MEEIEYVVSRGAKYSHRTWNKAPLLIVGERVYNLRSLADWVAGLKAWMKKATTDQGLINPLE